MGLCAGDRLALLTPLAKRRSGPKPGAAGLCAAALGLTAGIGYLARSESGYLALLFAGLLLLYYSLRCDSWRLRGAVWLGLAAGFLLPVLAFRLTMEMRTAWYDLPPVKPDSFASHGIWHNALIGLGYVSNRWGLEWSDDNGWRFAQEHCPGVGFATPQYFACLRDGFFRIVWSDPGLLVRNLATKSVMMLAWLLTLPVALWAALGVVTARPRPTLVWLLIWTLVSLLPGLLAIPDYVYIQAFLCAVVCLGAISVLEYRT